ncbi:DUF637 domain-containing protein, partial [Moraxella catarrhalis]
NRNDVDWQQIILTDKDWDYKQQGLTPAGAAIVAIAVAYATGGVGTALTSTVATATGSTTLGTMTSAAFSSLVTQASISLIDNQGNIKQTLKDLGSKQSVRQLGFAIASAGIGSKINKSLGLSNTDITQAGFNDRLIKGIADGTSRGLLESAVYGVDLEEALKQSLTKELVGLGTQNIFKDIIHDIDGDALARNIAHKLAAGLTGCLSAKAVGNRCEAGSIGAVVGEMWGDYHNTLDPSHPNYQNQKDKLINQAKLIAGITAVFAGEDVNVAAGVAAEAVENNATFIDKKNEVKKVILNGDKGIYQCNFQNDKCIDNPIKIGETMFEDAFISPDTGNPVGRVYIGESIDEYIYRLNDKAWSAGFYAEELYAYNSLPGNIYDIKSSYPNHERKSYHGFLFDGKYITLREGGNILAGMNAATLGIPYEEFQKASGALHAGGKLGLIRHKTTGYTYGTYPRYGEIDYQYLRSRYGYSLGLKRIECNLNNTNSLECKK